VLSEKAHSFRHSTEVTNENISNASRQNRFVRTGINGTRPKFQKEFSVNSHSTAVTAILPFLHCFASSLPV
jgi:hypothetical protein